jgi:DNA-binding CsgD family transcriptional regulator
MRMATRAPATDAVRAATGHGDLAGHARHRKGPGGLSRRQIEVLSLAAKGFTTQQIAERMFIAAKTGPSHPTRLPTDWSLDQGRRRALGDAKRRRSLNPVRCL